VRAGRHGRLRFTTSAPAAVAVVVTRRGRAIARLTARARPGRNVLVLRRLRAGRYAVRLTARGAGGRTVVARATLVVYRP
jgi:antitoxin (DNA-binding transcriptional repressor) of toxin-antitoxin stability system